MYTAKAIRSRIVPVPQQVTVFDSAPLVLNPGTKFSLSTPSAEKGPVKTAVKEISACLQQRCGENCFDPQGIPVILSLETPPENLKNPREAYCIEIRENRIAIIGYGDSGLFYGVGSFCQLCRFREIPPLDILDWPDNPFRGYKQECRYGSNLMEKEDWFAMIDDLAAKKINQISVALYGCWVMQYDGQVAEYLYLPLKGYPQLKTPMTVKYYSPTEGKWYNYQQLPPIYRDNLFGEIVSYCADRGIVVIPGFNSLGHNTLIPRLLPEVAPKLEDGTPQPTGFCTSCEETYEFLFRVYDQIIDEYLIPNKMYSFNILLDEVWEQYGVDPNDPATKKTPWCQCPKCRGKERSQLFIEHAIKIIKHLKEKGMKSIMVANDMLVRKVSKLGDLSAPFLKRIGEEGLKDVLLFDWWRYTDLKEGMDFVVEPDELNFRSIFCPWNGYYIWSLLTHPMRNNQLMAEMNHKAACGEGVYQYALWDRSYDRIHDCFADYGWNFVGAGTLENVTDRYVTRHFAPMERKIRHAYRLMELCTEQRPMIKDPENPDRAVISHYELMFGLLSYYPYCYYRDPKMGDYPRHFPGEGIGYLLEYRVAYERALKEIAAMAKEAAALFEEAAQTPGCDQDMARRMAYECRNYQVLTEDWQTLLEMYDLTQKGDYAPIASLARERQNARIALMELCEQTKEAFVVRAATMRNHSVFMQFFADIAIYLETADAPQLNLLDITSIMSQESWMLR